MAAAAELPPRPLRPLLGLASHNTCTLSTPQAAEAAARDWGRAGIRVVLIQEHRLTLFTAPAVARRLARLGWTAYFSFSGEAAGGTAIILRTSLITDGTLELVGGDAAVRRGPGGRYIAAPFRWSGHRLHIASVYLPSGNPTAQRAYITSHLAPLAAAAIAAGCQLVWGGDFNFVPDPRLDRLRVAAPSSHPDGATQRRWEEALPGLIDAWRHRHPGRRSFTFVRAGAASRLDRFYISQPLLPHLATCSVRDRTTSDHRPVTLTLTGLRPADVGPGRARLRMRFAADPNLARQLQAWLAEQAAAAPVDDPHALLIWWPQFKHRLALKCRALHRASLQLSATAEAAQQELAAAHASLEEGDDAALPAVVAARQRFAEAWRAHTAELALQRRHSWLHRGERPCPALTRRLRPALARRQVLALRSATGALLTRGTALAQRVADHWAAISEQPLTDAAAQQEVLAALAGGRRLSAQQAELLGSTGVTEMEVRAALRTAPSGRSPGHDGIPVELWRRFKDVMAPLLARLFTAINAADALPARFLEGLITVIFKAGDHTDPSNYRPITLLCTDYRLYAKVLARRLNPHLADIIDPEQTAFVPGRRIGENVMTLQCLHELLRAQGRSALAVFTDTYKAYDTCDRGFLFSAMDTLGVGAGFLSMVRRLLTATASRAHVNGWTSTPAATAAGVRQGCPLSPLLYLFVAQALLRLLKTRGIGIDAAGLRLAALQYADDTVPLLPDQSHVPPLLAAYDTFRSATGQRLHLQKTKVLPIGAVPAGLPAAAHGLGIVSAATTLGVTFGSAANPTARWPDLVAGVEGCYKRIAGLPKSFSVFGRAFAASAYGISKALYHAEFTGHPPPQHLARLVSSTARLVDRRLAPGDAGGRFAGVAARLQPGRPPDGGFGALAWTEHITSRHAWWAAQLITAPATTPWVAVARALLRACAPAVGQHPLGLLVWPAGPGPQQHVPGRASPLPQPLHRLHAALAALPPVRDTAGEPLLPGPWCLAAPLWGNPLLATPDAPGGIDLDFLDLAAAGISTLARLVAARAATAATLNSAAAFHLVWSTILNRHGSLANRHHAADRLQQLCDALPPDWLAAAEAAAAAVAAGQLPPPTEEQAMAVMLPRLGWQLPDQPEPLLLTAYTVRAGTAILTAPVEQERRQRLEAFAALAGGSLEEVRELLPALWRLPWENCHKEPYWRLAHNALPTADRIRPGQPCLCGAAQPGRLHHYGGGCPPCAAIHSSIHAALSAARPGAAPPTVQHLWLMRPPPHVHAGAWRVVCLAALSAAESSRQRMYALSAEPAADPDDIVRRTSRWAVARFWALLADFVALRCVPRAWRRACPPDHPFLSYDSQARRWCVNRPVMPPHTPSQ